jgi:hypothetical protein
MKTQIVITGQINSVRMLRNSIENHSVVEVTSYFNNVTLNFKNKKDAVKALSEGYQYIKTQDPEDSMFSYSRGVSMSYDAGRAVLVQ